ncbi:MAG: efflux RND transporter periplasmic adaptor subunit [Pirellulales bacterium]
MYRRTPVVAGLAILSTYAALCAGCNRTPPPAAQVEEAPYRLDGTDHLIVRADLMPRLQMARVERSPIQTEVAGFGEVAFAPGAQSAVRVPFDGFVEEVAADLGEEIREGAVLAKIRSRELAEMRAKVARISAELDAEYDARERTMLLVSENALTERKLIEVKARIAGLEAERTGILQSLHASRIPEEGSELFELRAPRSGSVIARRIDPGESAQDPQNEPAFVIADPKQLVVRASFPERDAPLLRTGFPCQITIPSLGNASFTGRVSAVVPAVDARKRTVQAVCKFEKLDPRVRAEMLAHTKVSVEGEPKLLAPRSAVLLRRDVRVVMVKVGDDRLERRQVETGANVGDRVEIVSGLKEGEEVVVEGAVLLDGELDRLL